MPHQDIFDDFFRAFNFTSIFDDEPFASMSQSNLFDPHEFGINYNQNFRSSMRRNRPGQRRSDLGMFGNIMGDGAGFGFEDFIE